MGRLGSPQMPAAGARTALVPLPAGGCAEIFCGVVMPTSARPRLAFARTSSPAPRRG
jgi:hypothetical protein